MLRIAFCQDGWTYVDRVTTAEMNVSLLLAFRPPEMSQAFSTFFMCFVISAYATTREIVVIQHL
eukprot:8074579-Prorocentrum_lima.AAC.1